MNNLDNGLFLGNGVNLSDLNKALVILTHFVLKSLEDCSPQQDIVSGMKLKIGFRTWKLVILFLIAGVPLQIQLLQFQRNLMMEPW